MKKFIITMALAAMPFLTFAQTNAFSKFDDVEGIQVLNLNKEMFNIIGGLEDSAKDEATKGYLELASKLDNLQMYTTAEKKYRKQIKEAVTDYLKTSGLVQLMTLNDDDASIKLYVKQGDDESVIKEGLAYIESKSKKEETLLVTFTGNLSLKDVEALKDFNTKGPKGTKGDKGEKGRK